MNDHYEDVLIREAIGYDQPDHDDACMVCDKVDCVCPPENEREIDYNRSQFGPPR
jgi:hypothetical protein